MQNSLTQRKRLRKVLRELFDLQNGICTLCEEPMDVTEASLDHVIPQKFGGKSGPKTAVHKICNSIKGHSLIPIKPETYRERKAKILARLVKRVKKSKKKNLNVNNRPMPKSWEGAGVIMDDTGKLFFRE